MLNFIKKIFNKSDVAYEMRDINIKSISMQEISEHLRNYTSYDDKNAYRPAINRLSTLKQMFDDNNVGKKIIFILDDDSELVDILVSEFEETLTRIGCSNKFLIVGMSGKDVGFDMLTVISMCENLKIDYLITDVTFGGNKSINNKKVIIDGVDIAILAKERYPDMVFRLFTGNILSESNVRNYNFAKKFEKYFGESILEYTITKEIIRNLEDNFNIIDFLIEGCKNEDR